MGVIVFAMVSGALPFGGARQAMKQKIMSGSFHMDEAKWGHISKECVTFVMSLLEVDPKDRLTARQALKHKWLQQPSHNKERNDSVLPPSLLDALQTYKAAPKFQQLSLLAMTWHLTSQQTAKMRETFLAIDTDQRGTISVAKFKDVVMPKFGIAENEALDLFNAIDANHDGEIHYSEYLAAMLSTQTDLKLEHVGITFRDFDEDLNGYITTDNLHNAFGDTFEGKQVDALLDEVDLLADGRVSFNEFVAFVCDVPLRSKDVGPPYPIKPANVPPVRVGKTLNSRRVAEAQPKCCVVM